MPTFVYTARKRSGEQVEGLMQADSEAAVVRALDEQAMVPVRIVPQQAPGRRRGGKVRLREVGVIYSQLGDLLGAGVPMMRALTILARVGLSDRAARIMVEVRENVAAGETLADAMDRHPEVFSGLHTAVIRAGERAGFLEDALHSLAGYIERQDELSGKVRGAMIYPTVLTVAGAAIVTFLLVWLVPRFEGMFEGMEVPLPTRVLFALSGLLRHHLLLVVGGLVLAAVSLRSLLGSRTGRLLWETWRLKLPVLGRTLQMVGVTRFCRVLGTMLANGVPILQALAIAKDATGSAIMAASIEQAAENVRAGDALAEPLDRSGLFPPEIVEMIAVGEESNQLETVLVRTADTVDRRTARLVDQAVRLMEPVILILLAALVGFIAMGLLYPVFMMSQTLQ
ncbi:MAG: type II secretion system F family protein [Planctomycetes bacterium]|nr:type II secretion system F family protein [Planctomycetota bacterium]